MVNVSEFSFTHFILTAGGILAYARYHDWSQEFSFMVGKDGSVKGRTFKGNWLELTNEFSSAIRSRIQSLLIEQPNIVTAYQN